MKHTTSKSPRWPLGFIAPLMLGLAIGCHPPGNYPSTRDGGDTNGAPGSGGNPGTAGKADGTSGGGAGGRAASGGAMSSGGSGNGGGDGGGGDNSGGGGNGNGTGGSGDNAGRGGMAGAGTAGTGGHAGAATASGGGGGLAPTCIDDNQNGDETGVDCGGSCPACPNYKINPPNLKNNVVSGCAGGGQGFMCTRSMAFSPELKQAAKDDWGSGDPPFVYGVVGHDKDPGGVDGNYSNTCCQCYQLIFTSPMDPVTGLTPPKPMIVQAFNTAAGGPKNFDIYMAKGGEGANTAGCSAQYSQFPTVGEPNNGGIRPLNFSAECAVMNKYTASSISLPLCQDQINAQCTMIQASASATNQSTSQVSCIEASQPGNLYHINWNVMAKRVECPTNLTRVTGCKLAGQGLPEPDPNAKDAASATNGFMTGYTNTTMQDCCRPTCAYAGNVNNSGVTPDSSYGAFYTCDKAGNPS